MSGPGGIWVQNPDANATISLTGTGKTFTGIIYASGSLTAGLDINTTTTPRSVYVRAPAAVSGTALAIVAPLQVSASGTLGSGPVEVQAGGLIVKSATCLNSNSSVLVGRSPMNLGYLSIQYDGDLPANLDANSTGFIALDVNYSKAIPALGNLFLGCTADTTFSGLSWSAGSGNTYRLGGGWKTLTLDAAGTTTGVLTGSGNSLIVGVPASRLMINRSPGVISGGILVTLKDDNDFGGSITVNNYSSLNAVKPATSTTTSPLGANGTDKPVTLNGGDLRLDNYTVGVNGLTVTKGTLTVSARNMITVLASSTKTAQLIFNSLAWDNTWGGALILSDGSNTSLGNYGKIKVNSLSSTNLVTPRILLASNAGFVKYDSSNGLMPADYVDRSSDFTPTGEIARTTSALTINAGTLKALTLAGGTVTVNGTVNITSGGLSVDTSSARTLTGGTIHFGNAGENTVEGFIGLSGTAVNNLTLSTALDGGAGVTFFSHYGTSQSGFRSHGGMIVIDSLPVSSLDGKMKILSNTTIGFTSSGTTDFGTLFPNLDAIVFNGGRMALYNRTVTIPQAIEIGPNGALFCAEDTAQSFNLTLNGNISGSGPLVIDGGGGSTVTAFNGDNSGFSGDVTIGGGSHTVAATSSLGTGNVVVKLGSGSVAAYLYLLGDANIASNRRLSFDTLSSNSRVYFRSATPAIGSLEGCGGAVYLGPASGSGQTTLTVGGDNTSTVFAGQILDAGTGRTGALTKTGTGTLTLMGTCTYTGTTTINGGTLMVLGDFGSSTNPVVVNNGGTLAGDGLINRPVIVNSGGVLSPGLCIGTLTTSNLTLSAGCTNLFEIGTATNCDKVVVNGNLILAGVLSVSAAEGFVGSTYEIFSYTGSLTDNKLELRHNLPPPWTAKIQIDTVQKKVFLIVSRIGGTVFLIQ
jgi:autotransporter-associated beta strand protein